MVNLAFYSQMVLVIWFFADEGFQPVSIGGIVVTIKTKGAEYFNNRIISIMGNFKP